MSNGQNTKRVLVVDDDGAVLELLQSILEAGGYSVTAASGAEAAAKCFITNCRVDLLVTDVEMPGKTGIELAEELSNQQPGLPVLFVTGGVTVVEARKGLPPPHVLSKPFSAGALLASVEHMLSPN